MVEKEKKTIQEAIADVLLYTGMIGAVITAIAFIITTIVMIVGYNEKQPIERQLVNLAISTIFGIVIFIFMREQGISFAKSIDKNKVVEDEYKLKTNKKKKPKALKQINNYRTWALIKDILVKSVTIAISMFSISWLAAEGSGDWAMLLSALSNLLMFVGMGMLNMNTAYTKYNEEHIPVLKEEIRRLDELASIPTEETDDERIEE